MKEIGIMFEDSLSGVYRLAKFIQDNLPEKTKIRVEEKYVMVENCGGNDFYLKPGDRLTLVREDNYIVSRKEGGGKNYKIFDVK